MDLDWFRLGWVSLLVALVWAGWREVSTAGRARAHEQSYAFSLANFVNRLLGSWVFVFAALALTTYLGLTRI